MTFNFDQYPLADEIIESEDITNQEKETFDFSKYPDYQEMGYFGQVAKKAKRHASRIGSRVGETLLGMPGDVVNFVNWLDSKMPELPKFLKKDPNFVQKLGVDLMDSLPSSSELKEKMSEITEGYTDPQSSFEEFGDNIVELATILTMGKDPTKIKNLMGSLGKSFVAKSASKTAEEFGAGEKGQLAAEMGSLFLMGLISQPMADKYVGDQYKKARNLIPQNTMIPTGNLEQNLSHLETELSKGISTSTKNEVKSAVKELKNKVSGGSLPAEEIVDSFHDINERLTSKKLFEDLSRPERKKLKIRYDKLKSEVSKEIKDYGKYNPEFYNKWKEANEGYATIQKSKGFTNWLQSHMGRLPEKLAGSMALEVLMGHPELAVGTLGAGAGVKIGELMYRISKSPILRKHYLNSVKSALKEDYPAFIKNAEKLDNSIKKEISK